MAARKLPSTGDVPRNTGVPASLVPGGSEDSGGYAWAGRTFDHHGTEFADDDGKTPREWAEAVARLRDASERVKGAQAAAEYWDAVDTLAEVHSDVLQVLSRQRLLVPLVTEAGDVGLTPEGRTVEKTQELAMVTVAAPDGRSTLPAFSSVEAMLRWNEGARPIPQPAPQVAVAAAGEGNDIIMIDAGTPGLEFGVRRTQQEAVALGERIQPSWADDHVLEAFRASVADESKVRSITLAPADLDARLQAPECEVVLKLTPGLDRKTLQDMLGALQQLWATDEVITRRVDSMRLRLV